jgi:glycosyltransferase involved in cell wall biosynthesis
MNILTISNCLPLDYLGSGYVISNFVKGMRALGHKVDLIQPDNYEICQFVRPRANSYRQSIGMLFALKRALKKKEYDLIEFWGGEAWLSIQWLVKRKGTRPLVVQHTNGPEPRYNHLSNDNGLIKQTSLQRWHTEKLMLKAFMYPDGVVTVSEYDRLWLEQQGLPLRGNLKAIEVPLPSCLLDRALTQRESRVIGFCGTWLPKKGIDVLVSDISRLLKEFPEWRFMVLGTSPNADVQSYFPEEVRNRVEVLPIILEKEALARQYEQMEIFVLPSYIESFGVALAEAMACGCAVVTTRVGLGATLQCGRQALLLEEPKSPHLYESVKQLILNPELRRQLGIAAWKRVQGLRWEHAVSSLSETYQHWLAELRQTA